MPVLPTSDSNVFLSPIIIKSLWPARSPADFFWKLLVVLVKPKYQWIPGMNLEKKDGPSLKKDGVPETEGMHFVINVWRDLD